MGIFLVVRIHAGFAPKSKTLMMMENFQYFQSFTHCFIALFRGGFILILTKNQWLYIDIDKERTKNNDIDEKY